MQKLKYYVFKFKMRKKNIYINSQKASTCAKYNAFCLISANSYISDDVELGRYTYINENCSIENCKIGSFCSIAANTYINPFNHNKKYISTHPFLFNSFYHFVDKSRTEKQKKVIIGNDVWIGLNSVILSGCSIGDGAIIGAGSIVTHDIPAYEIWGGVPARKLSDRFSQEEKDFLEKSEWWNYPVEKIKKMINRMYRIEDFCDENDKQ